MGRNMNKNVKWLLIRKFILVLLGIYLGSQALMLLYRLVLLPEIEAFFASQQITVTGNSNLIGWLIFAFFYFLAGFLPSGLAGWLQRGLGAAMGDSLRISVTSPLYNGAQGMLLRVFISCLILFLLLLRLLPYVAGAFLYYRTVVEQFHVLLLQEQAQKLALDKRRNLLLSDVAHDIKTPITTICGYSRALSEGLVAEEKIAAYLDVIYQKALRMDELLTLLFEYVKLDSEGFTLHKERGNLAELVRKMTAMLYQDFENKSITVVTQISEENAMFEMDALQLGRAITNLLTNALRYGKEGGRVFVRLTDLEITVADDGEPIDPEFAEHIFDPFTRGDRARTSEGGSGLGLGIAKKIVEMHGGKLVLNRHFGEGYTKAFQIYLYES